jgi:hypothetical protein
VERPALALAFVGSEMTESAGNGGAGGGAGVSPLIAPRASAGDSTLP